MSGSPIIQDVKEVRDMAHFDMLLAKEMIKRQK